MQDVTPTPIFAGSTSAGLIWIIGLILYVSAAPAAPDNVTTSISKKPNILLLLADDMGWGDLPCQGNRVIKLPNLERLAASGARLAEFYCSAPVCSPSRAGLLTGRIQNRFGMQHLINDDESSIPVFHHIPIAEPMLPRLLHDAGYATAHIGKWHLSFVGRPGEPWPNDYGFDYSLVLAAGRHTSYRDSSWMRNRGERIQTAGRWTAEVYVDEAIQFIDKNPTKPWFINLWSFAPHQEVDCAPEFRALYADRPVDEQYYLGTLTQIDQEYGRLLDYLDKKGLAENTIVLFTSDNGAEPHTIPWSRRAHGSSGGWRGAKHHLYEGGIKVPSLLRWPGVTKPGSVVYDTSWTLDYLPTLCAAAGAQLPDNVHFDGNDIALLLRGEQLSRTQPFFWQFPFVGVALEGGGRATSPQLALRDGDWKILCDTDFSNIEFYNLALDPGEQWNMKDRETTRTQTLLEEMKRFYTDVNGPYSKNANFLNPEIKIPTQLPARRDHF